MKKAAMVNWMESADVWLPDILCILRSCGGFVFWFVITSPRQDAAFVTVGSLPQADACASRRSGSWKRGIVKWSCNKEFSKETYPQIAIGFKIRFLLLIQKTETEAFLSSVSGCFWDFYNPFQPLVKAGVADFYSACFMNVTTVPSKRWRYL